MFHQARTAHSKKVSRGHLQTTSHKVQAENKAILKSEVVRLVDATWNDAFWLLKIQLDSWTLVDLATKEKVEFSSCCWLQSGMPSFSVLHLARNGQGKALA
jgi:hypothetical protein